MPIFAVYRTIPSSQCDIKREIHASSTRVINTKIGIFIIKWIKTCHIEIEHPELDEFQFCRDSASWAVGYFHESETVRFVIINMLLGTCTISPAQRFGSEFVPRCINHPVNVDGEVIQLSVGDNRIVYLEPETGLLHKCKKETYAPPLISEPLTLTIEPVNGAIRIGNISGFFCLEITGPVRKCYRSGGRLYMIGNGTITETRLTKNELARFIQ